jgi:membrane protease YdiL (CAAX protease family)
MSLRHKIQSLSDTTEVVVVVTIAFGYFIVESVLRLFQLSGAPIFVALPLRNLAMCQVAILIVIGLFLGIRGWRFADFGEQPRFIDVLLGIPLAVGAYLPFWLLWSILWFLLEGDSTGSVRERAPMDLSGLNLRVILAAAFINSVFEEVLVVGYVSTALRRQVGLWAAVHTSALIRLAYHAHQGVAGVLSILPLGYVFAYWYIRRRSLTPLVTAHMILDVIAYSLYRVA